MSFLIFIEKTKKSVNSEQLYSCFLQLKRILAFPFLSKTFQNISSKLYSKFITDISHISSPWFYTLGPAIYLEVFYYLLQNANLSLTFRDTIFIGTVKPLRI